MSEAPETLEKEAEFDLAKITGSVQPKGDVFSRRHDGSTFDYDGSLSNQDFDELLKWAAERKASDVTIQTDEKVKAEIGGEIVPITRRPLTTPEVENIVRYVYGDHGPGRLIAGYDLDPSHEVRMGKDGLRRYRVNCTSVRVPGGNGIQITIRTLPTAPIKLKDLGIEQEIYDNISPNQGMILVTGPTGSGKSTLLSSIIREIVEKPDANKKILEYSTPIEYVYDGVPMPSSSVAQTEVGRQLRPADGEGRDTNESLYAYAVRNALRRKPHIIVIGEARDKATIQASVEAALTGHLLYSTLHVIGVAETLRRAVQPFPGDERSAMAVDIMQSMRMIVTQLLFPRKGGGRVACREFMIFDDRTRARFLNKHVDEWPSFARKLMAERSVVSRKMSESAWRLFKAGDISADIYKSIVAAERDKA